MKGVGLQVEKLEQNVFVQYSGELKANLRACGNRLGILHPKEVKGYLLYYSGFLLRYH